MDNTSPGAQAAANGQAPTSPLRPRPEMNATGATPLFSAAPSAAAFPLFPVQVQPSPLRPLGLGQRAATQAPPPLLLSHDELAGMLQECETSSASVFDSALSASEGCEPRSPFDLLDEGKADSECVASALDSGFEDVQTLNFDLLSASENFALSLMGVAAEATEAAPSLTSCAVLELPEDIKPFDLAPHLLLQHEQEADTRSLSSGHHSHGSKPYHRKEPRRDEFASNAAFEAAWEKWRRSRNSNNKSVQRCRVNMRDRKHNHAILCKQLEQDQVRLHTNLLDLVQEMAFFNRALANPESLSEADKARLRAAVAEEMQKEEC